jgi:hypothetical protein
MVNGVAGTVNHHSAGAGEFSVGDLGNFQLALTGVRSGLYFRRFAGQVLFPSMSEDDDYAQLSGTSTRRN